MVRTPTVDKNGIRRGAWSEEEDNILKTFVLIQGHLNWRQLPRFAGLARCGKSCRLRWKNYLKPDLKRGNYTEEEVEQIIKLRQEHGNRWSLIASKLHGRTDNGIKNYWHTHLKSHENISENLHQIQGTDSMDLVSVLMSTSQSIQWKEIDNNTEVSSMNCNSTSLENLDSMDSTDSIQEDFGGISHEPFLFNTSNDLITQSINYDQLKEFESTGADSFPEVSSIKCNSMDTLQEDFGELWDEPFLFNTPNNKISQFKGYDSMEIICTEPFLLESSDSQCLPYDWTLSDASVAGIFETFGNKPFTLDTYNSQNLPSLESEYSYSTQTLSVGASSADHALLSSTTSKIEGCTAPFMPFETSDDELLNLLSVVHSFMISDEDQNNITLF